MKYTPPISDGVYCDASFDRKEGIAKLGVVRIAGNEATDCHKRTELAENIQEAEALAVALAASLYPGEPIFTDNAWVSRAMGCNWIPRALNVVADCVASSRLKPKPRRKHSKHGGAGATPRVIPRDAPRYSSGYSLGIPQAAEASQ